MASCPTDNIRCSTCCANSEEYCTTAAGGGFLQPRGGFCGNFLPVPSSKRSNNIAEGDVERGLREVSSRSVHTRVKTQKKKHDPSTLSPRPQGAPPSALFGVIWRILSSRSRRDIRSSRPSPRRTYRVGLRASDIPRNKVYRIKNV